MTTDVTVKDALGLMADASDAGDPKVGIYKPFVSKVQTRKNGDTVIDFRIVVGEFTLNEVMDNFGAWIVCATKTRMDELLSQERERRATQESAVLP